MNDHNVTYAEPRECIVAIRKRLRLLAGVSEPQGYVIDARLEKTELYVRANLIFFRAMLTGSLVGWFVEDGERWQIPGWAWADQGGDWTALVLGNDFLHPLAPPDVRRWAWLPVKIERAAFLAWVASDELVDKTGFPDLPPAHDEVDRPPYVTHAPPPDRPNVPLAHALSWLAFGISLDADTLTSALAAGVMGADRIDAHHKLERATDQLLAAGTGGLVMLGKYVPVHGSYDAAETVRIKPERLEDFRQFEVAFDGLCYGVGLSCDWTDPGVTSLARSLPAATHKYVDVKVDRRALMALGQPRDSTITNSLLTENIVQPRVARLGRKPGSGSFAGKDAPLLAEMRLRIERGEAVSPQAAALSVADRASGGGTVESKATRLAKAYRASEINGGE